MTPGVSTAPYEHHNDTLYDAVPHVNPCHFSLSLDSRTETLLTLLCLTSLNVLNERTYEKKLEENVP